MKKLMIAVAAIGLMAVSAFGVEGTVHQVITKSNGTIIVVLLKTDGTGNARAEIGGTAEGKKAMLANILTAKASTATVDGYTDASGDWSNFTLK